MEPDRPGRTLMARWKRWAERAAGVVVPKSLRPGLRPVAIRRGILPAPPPPPFLYPFGELLASASTPHYPNYRWGILSAAAVAGALGYERITAIEFGVAGGNGPSPWKSALAKRPISPA